jgi:hypothetical protein
MGKAAEMEKAWAMLAEYRASIDNIDAALVHMLAERFSRPSTACRPPIRRGSSSRSPAFAGLRTTRSSILILPRNS